MLRGKNVSPRNGNICPAPYILFLRQNVDCLQLAHELSAKAWITTGSPKVAILNGASRKLVGNHWFQGGARYAIDENLHRRSSSMARAALLLNLNTEPKARKPLALANQVSRWGGQVFAASNGKLLSGRSKEKPKHFNTY